MENYLKYVGVLAIGLVLGWILFGDSSNKDMEHNHDQSAEVNQLWTCSMHPQIMQPEAGDCPICGMDLIPAANSSEELTSNQFEMSENAMALANIETSAVRNDKSGSEPTINLTGKIAENEDNTATQSAHFNGRIDKLYTKSLGTYVSHGQAIAQVYSPELVKAQQELLTAYKVRKSQPTLYKAIRNKFKNWNINDTQLSEVEETGVVKSQFTIYARVSGFITELAVKEGSHIMDGHPIFKVSNLSTVWAQFDAYEKQLSSLNINDRIAITTNANPNKIIEATISFIDPILDVKTRTVIVRAKINNSNGALKPGMFVKGVVSSRQIDKTNLLTIPKTAVLWTGKRSVVYVKTEGTTPVFEMRNVILGKELNESYEVLEGLEVNEVIVINGTFTVDAAAQLQGKKSMMNKEGGKVMTGHEGHVDMEETMSITNESHSNMNERIKVSNDFQNQLKMIFDRYISIKNALVKDDSKKVVEVAKALFNNLGQVNMKLLTDDKAHNYWISLEKELKVSVNSISNTTSVKEQRIHFKNLSSHLANALQLFGINEKVYYQFCPMADNNNGAYWLSKEKKVINPYFGSAMYNRGEIKQVIE